MLQHSDLYQVINYITSATEQAHSNQHASDTEQVEEEEHGKTCNQD